VRIWLTELSWAAAGLARSYPRHLAGLDVVYVLREGGPNWAEKLTAVATVVAALGVVAAIIGAWIARRSLRVTLEQVRVAAEQLHEAEKLRHISLVIEMARRWDDDAMLSVRLEIGQMPNDQFKRQLLAALEGNQFRYFQWVRLANYFEDFGALVTKECLDPSFVETTIGGSVKYYWGKWRDPVIELRNAGQDEMFDNWEKLAVLLGFSPE
jgi:hypothetical protein